MNMTAVIIVDERLATERLIDLLNQTAPDIEIITSLESVEQSINWLSANPLPDLIFMDIQLDDGISFEILETLKIEVPVIFTTAYNEYAIKAFKVNSVDYLLKPVDKAALGKALDKFRKVFRTTDMEEKLSRVVEQISKPWKTRFFVKVGSRFQSIPVTEISCFYVEEKCTFLKTIGNKNYALDYSLDQLQKRIDPNTFFRINRGYIVNIRFIADIISYSTNRLKLKIENCDEEGLIVSRDKVAEFKLWLDQ